MLEGVQGSPPVLGSANQFKSKALNRQYYCSSLSSARKKAVLGKILSWPLRILGQFFSWIGTYLRDYVFCCCANGKENHPVKWSETKDAFTKIHNEVMSSQDDGTSREKRFAQAYKELSDAAKERFREHIGFAKAKQEHSISDRAEQEKWYQENRDKIDFHDDFFTKIPNNIVLQNAVKAFYNEIIDKGS
ncbi:MAG: hypothetical protein K1000chlam2_01702 [Chlamydiae bacterium]|nr:hypothetical protein [Chlamydiota bacterium]